MFYSQISTLLANEEVPFLFGQSSENTFFQCYLGKREKPKIKFPFQVVV